MELVKTLVDILMTGFKQQTLAFLDARFMLELEGLRLTESEQNRVFSLWLIATQKHSSMRRELTDDEKNILIPVFQQIVNRYQEQSHVQ